MRSEQHRPTYRNYRQHDRHTEIDRAIEDARQANEEFFIRDENG